MTALMRATRSVVLLVLVAAMLAPPAIAADFRFYYLNPSQIDLTVLLPPPPDVNSPEEQSDEQQVAAAVAARSQAQFVNAEEAKKRSVFFFMPSIGPGFTAARLPVTTRFFSHVKSDVQNLIDQAKVYWDRPRPNGVQSRRGSYPSGHAAFAASTAILLGELIPAKRDAIFAQARVFAENRILLGLHYPSDVAAGWTAGTLAVYVMMSNRAFQRDFAATKAELRRAHL
jgi:acid phosphatase (class A)